MRPKPMTPMRPIYPTRMHSTKSLRPIRPMWPTRLISLIWLTRLVQPTRSTSLRPLRLMRSMRPTRPLLHLIALAHIFSVAVVFNGTTFTCARTFGFAIATVVEIEGNGKIEQFASVFSDFCSTTALPFTPSQNILQSMPKTRDILEYPILDLNADAPGVS